MANGKDNLIPFSERSKEEARACGKKGGIKSGKVRKKVDLKKAMELLLSLNISDPKIKNSLRVWVWQEIINPL